jgi:hypothetical protein
VKFFSLAQCIGYVAFVFGLIAFRQKRDRPLKFYVGVESLFYTLHFFLLGNMTAAASALITSFRSFLALKTRSFLVAGIVIAANILVGIIITRSAVGWLPVIGSCISTYAVFTMKGVPMRLAILVSTFCWLTNNILSGSIGGTMLEAIIAIVNTSTMVQMLRSHDKTRGEDAEEAPVRTVFE